MFSKSQNGFPLPQGRLPDRGCQQDGFPADKEQRKGGTKFLPLPSPRNGNITIWTCQGHLASASCTFHSHTVEFVVNTIKTLVGWEGGAAMGGGCKQRRQQDLRWAGQGWGGAFKRQKASRQEQEAGRHTGQLSCVS